MATPRQIPNPLMGVGGGQRKFSGERRIIRFRLCFDYSGYGVNDDLLETKSGGTLSNPDKRSL